jgi:hypothetical protein
MAKKKTLAQRIAADPALKAKYLANPGLRSKLPASMLTPAQRKTREAIHTGRQPVTPGSTVTNSQLGRETQSATDLRYGGQQQALQTQQAKAEALGRDVGGWYDSYRAELAKHAQQTQAISANAQQSMQQLGTGLQGLNTGGSPTDQQAAAVRAQMFSGFGAQQAGIGAANSQYANTQANVVAPGQQLRARAQSAQGVRDVGDKLTALEAEKGAFKEQYKSGRVADESKNVLANRALGANIADDQADNAIAAARVTTQAQHNAASRRETARSHRANETAAQARIRVAQERAAAAGKPKAKARPRATPIQQGAAKDEIAKVRSAIETLRKNGAKSKSSGETVKLTDTQIRAALKAKGMSNDYINAAYDLIVHGKLSPANVKALHRRGLSIRDLGFPTMGSTPKARMKSAMQAVGRPKPLIVPK